MIHWLVVLYWVLNYAYTGNENEVPLSREFLIFMLGVLENGVWLYIYSIIKKIKGEK